EALPSSNAINWSSIPTSGVRLAEEHVVITGYDKYILVGATPDDTLHLAEINQANGNLTEVANTNLQGMPFQMDIGVINGEIFIVSAEGSSGMNVYKFTPPNNLQLVAGMP